MSVLVSIEREARALLGGHRGQSLAVIAAGWGVLLGSRMVYPVLLPYLRSRFGFSLAVAGLLLSVLWLGSAVGQLPGGMLADRYSERLVMTAGTVLVAGSILLVVTSGTPVVIFVSTAVFGLGQSLYPIARITVLSEIYPDRIGSSLGVTMATGDLGMAVFPPVAGAVAAGVAWQAGLGFAVPLLLAVGLGLWTTLPTGTSGDPEPVSRERARTVLAELRQSNVTYVGCILFLYILVWQSFTGLYPTYLVEVKELSSSAAGALFSVFFAAGVFVKPVAGAAYDRIGMGRALVAVLVGPAVGFALLPYVEGFWPIAGVTALVSTMLGSGAITQSFLSDSIAEEVQGTGLGVLKTVTATVGASGPVVFGAAADRGYFDEGYLLLAATMGAIVVLTLWVPGTTDEKRS